MSTGSISTDYSWVTVPDNSDFPIQNLPYGVFRINHEESNPTHIGVAIGDQILDLYECSTAGLFNSSTALNNGKVFLQSNLNLFMSLSRSSWQEARQIIYNLLKHDNPIIRDNKELVSRVLISQSSVTMTLPCDIGDYTDFYSSRNHAYNVGVMFRGPSNALQPNWSWLPVGYHGRSSSIIPSGKNFHRPYGQLAPDETKPPILGKCETLDFELELAVFVGGVGNKLGQPINMKDAAEHLFGVVLMNDWSARDIQKWEYVPLGPFTAKNFATTISPWIVTFEALEPFKCQNINQDPAPLSYLNDPSSLTSYDIDLYVTLQSGLMSSPSLLSISNAKYLYWSFAQQLVHHTITGCPMKAGDLLGSGTISGETDNSLGSMLELSWKGSREIKIEGEGEGGEGNKRLGVRKFLRDGDEICIKGKAKKIGYSIGFGECKGTVLPAIQLV